MNMPQKTRKFNAIDIIIAAVIIAAVAVCVVMSKSQVSSEADVGKKIVTLEITEKHIGFGENVVVGDKVTEKVEKKQIGTVTGVEVKPCEKNSYDRVTGEPTVTVIPERENVYVTMELDSNAEVAVGKMLSIITKHFTGFGYVTEIQ